MTIPCKRIRRKRSWPIKLKHEQHEGQIVNLRCWQTNANSLQEKRHELEIRVELAAENNQDPHVIMITETKYGPASVVNLAGYQIVRQDRNGKNPGGGICFYIRKDLKSFETKIEMLNSKEV